MPSGGSTLASKQNTTTHKSKKEPYPFSSPAFRSSRLVGVVKVVAVVLLVDQFSPSAGTTLGNRSIQKSKFDFLTTHQLGWCPENGNRSNQESKFDFLATGQCPVKIERDNKKNRPHQPTIKFMSFLPIN